MKKSMPPRSGKKGAMLPKAPASPLSRAAYANGGAVRGKHGSGATVNIVIGQPSAKAPGAPVGMPLPVGSMPAPVRGVVPPAGLAAGLPGAAPPPPAPGVPPMLAGKPIIPSPGMKRGGGVMAGAGSGLGRLQKKNHTL